MSSTFGLFFQFVHFCPYKEIVRGKPKKGKWLGKIKYKWRQLSPHSPSTQITSVLLHTSPSPPLHLLLGPYDGVVVRDDHFLTL